MKTKESPVSIETKEIKMIKVNLDDLKLFFENAEKVDLEDLNIRLNCIISEEQELFSKKIISEQGYDPLRASIKRIKQLFVRMEFISLIKNAE